MENRDTLSAESILLKVMKGFCEQAVDHGSRYIQTIMEIDICYILFTLSLLIAFQPSSADGSGTNNIDLILISNCSEPLPECPKDSRAVKFREQCINNFKRDSCPEETSYLCGNVDMYITETCAKNKECPPGTTHQFTVSGGQRKNTLECIPCPEGWFEPEFRNSSRFSVLPGCTYRHKPSSSISSNLVLFQNGTRSYATKWYCNIERGFYERDGKMFCDDVPTQRCNCVRKSCPVRHLLRPDGVCVRCSTRLDPERWFHCDTQTGTDVDRSKSLSSTETIPSTTSPNTAGVGTLSRDKITSILSSESEPTFKRNKYEESSETGERNGNIWWLLVPGLFVITACLYLVIRIIDWLFRKRYWVYKKFNRLCDRLKHQRQSEQNNRKVYIEKIQIEKNVSTTVDNSKNVYHQYNYHNCPTCNNGNLHSSKQHASSSSADGHSAKSNGFDHRMQNLKSFQTSTEENSSENEEMDYLTSNQIQGDRNSLAEETHRKKVY